MLDIRNNVLLEPLTVIKDGQLYQTIEILDRPAVLKYAGLAAHALFDLARRTTGTLWAVELWKGAQVPGRLIRNELRANYYTPALKPITDKIRWTHMVVEGGGGGQPARVIEPPPPHDLAQMDLAGGDQTALIDEMMDQGFSTLAALAEDYIADDSPLVCLINRDGPKLVGAARIHGTPFLLKPIAFPESQIPGQPEVLEPPFIGGVGTNLDKSTDGELIRGLEQVIGGPWGCRIATPEEIREIEAQTRALTA